MKGKSIIPNSLYIFRIQNHKGIQELLSLVNGNIRNSVRVPQFIEACSYYNITYKNANMLTLDNYWFSGFFDAEGSVTLYKSATSYAITVKVTNKYYNNLEPIQRMFNCGSIRFDRIPDTWKNEISPADYTYENKDKYPSLVLSWRVDNRKDILFLVDYFKKYPPRAPHKNYKLLTLVPEFYTLRANRAYRMDHPNHNDWLNHLSKW